IQRRRNSVTPPMSHKKSKKGGAFPPFSASACNLRVSSEDFCLNSTKGIGSGVALVTGSADSLLAAPASPVAGGGNPTPLSLLSLGSLCLASSSVCSEENQKETSRCPPANCKRLSRRSKTGYIGFC